jgi:hypothetical protein
MNYDKNLQPANIVTIEELIGWAVSALIGGGAMTKSIVEADGTRPEPLATASIFPIPDGTFRAAYRVSIPVKSDMMATAVPFWKKLDTVTTADIPANHRQA